MLTAAGATSSVCRTAPVTVSTALPDTPEAEAVMVVVPAATGVATPPAAMVATPGALEAQATTAVRSCRFPSVKIPVAVKGWATPSGTSAVDGSTEMAVRTASVTVSAVEFVSPAQAAETTVLPFATAVTSPPGATVAAAPLAEDQVAAALTSCLDPSE